MMARVVWLAVIVACALPFLLAGRQPASPRWLRVWQWAEQGAAVLMIVVVVALTFYYGWQYGVGP
jgi:hypothetical protein